MNLIFSLILLFSLAFSSALGRGGTGQNISSTPGSSASARRLFEDGQARTSYDKAKGYMSNSDLEQAVKAFWRRCSNISRIYSIGKSVNGFPLWVIEISDKPGVEEPEPAFKFIGNVHGDEPVGREMLIILVNWICDNHMKDPLGFMYACNMDQIDSKQTESLTCLSESYRLD